MRTEPLRDKPDTTRAGLTVKVFREAAGLSQGELAAATGVTRELISAIENGRRPVTPPMRLKIPARLGIPVAALDDYHSAIAALELMHTTAVQVAVAELDRMHQEGVAELVRVYEGAAVAS